MEMQSDPNLSPNDIFQKAWQTVKADPSAYMERAGLPVILSALAGVLVSLFIPSGFNFGAGNDPTDPAVVQAVFALVPVVLAGAAVSFVLIVMFSVSWYRHIMLRDARESGWLAIRWDSVRTRFLMCLLGLAMTAGGCGFAAAIASQLIGLPPIAAAGLLVAVPIGMFGRLCLCLPGVAVGDSVTIGDSWRMTRGYTMQMSLITVMPLIPAFIISVLVITLVSSLLGGVGLSHTLTATFILSLISEVIVYTGYAMQAGTIAEAYKRLKDRPV